MNHRFVLFAITVSCATLISSRTPACQVCPNVDLSIRPWIDPGLPGGDSLSVTADRWDIARHLNPFAMPIRTTDYYGSGDVNLDGVFDASDVDPTEAIIGGSEPHTDRADVNGDGSIDLQDMEVMKTVLSGARVYLPGWWDSLETREERDDWVTGMLAIDRTNNHPYQPSYFVCVHFANVLILNNTDYDGVFFGEPSRWITPGRFNLPIYHVSLSAVQFHSINGILVGDDPLDFDSWRFIEPQNDSDGRSWFKPGERIKIGAVESFSSPGGLKPRDLVIFQLDEEGKPSVEYAAPELVIKKLSNVTLIPPSPALGGPFSIIVRADAGQITQVRARIRLAGNVLEAARVVALRDDGAHNDGAANDGVWGGSSSILEAGNVILDVVATLQNGGETTYHHAAWFSTGEGKWHISPSGSDSWSGSENKPFRTVSRALEVVFPGDDIEISPGDYDELAVITTGGIRISRKPSVPGDVWLRELHVRYGTGIHIQGISFQNSRLFGSQETIFDLCAIGNLFSSFGGGYPKMRNCRAKELQAYNSAIQLFGSLIRNPDGPAVVIRCPRTTQPDLVPLQVFNSTIVDSGTGIQCTSDDETYPLTLKIANSILWGNRVDIDHDRVHINMARCDIESGWAGSGDNSSSNPLFADPFRENFRLGADSPCIDAGLNEDWMWSSADLDGNPRIWHGESSWSVDIGAYEHGSEGFDIIEITRMGSSTPQLTWNSRPGDDYKIQSRTDLSSGIWNDEETVSSQGDLTTWTDEDATSSRKAYRIGIE